MIQIMLFNVMAERAQKLAKQRALAFTNRGEHGRGDDEDEEVDLLLIEVCEAMLADDKRGLLAASANLTITLLGQLPFTNTTTTITHAHTLHTDTLCTYTRTHILHILIQPLMCSSFCTPLNPLNPYCPSISLSFTSPLSPLFTPLTPYPSISPIFLFYSPLRPF